MNQCFGCSTCKSADKPLEGFIADLPMETSHQVRVPNAALVCRVSVAVCVPTDRAVSHQRRQEESAEQLQMLL